jgi:hypothetical protein
LDARTGFVRLRGKDLTLEIVVTGCTGGGIVDLLNPAIIVAGQALHVNLLGVGGSSLGQEETTSRCAARLQNENPREI